MNQLTNTIPANSDKPCDACGRIHRKLFLVDSYWLGSACKKDYEMYKWNSNINTLQWLGYEKQYRKIEKMVSAK